MEEKVADRTGKEKHRSHLPTRPIPVNCPPILSELPEGASGAVFFHLRHSKTNYSSLFADLL